MKISYRAEIDVTEDRIKKAISSYFYIKRIHPDTFIGYCDKYRNRCRDLVLGFYLDYRNIGFKYYDNIDKVDECYGKLF